MIDNRLVRFLHELNEADVKHNRNGTIKLVPDVNYFVSMLNEYTSSVIHDLSKGIVQNNNLHELMKVNREIYKLKTTKFEDEQVPQLLLDLYNDNLKVLANLDEDILTRFEKDMLQNDIDGAKDLQSYYEAVLNKELRDTVRNYQERELKQVDALAKEDISALVLGIPYESVRRNFEDSETRLCNTLESIHEEAKRNNEQKQNLSNKPYNIKEHNLSKEEKLNTTLNAVADSVIRNNSSEKLISQRNKVKR
ncbi:MAG: hypothetical protein IAX21_01920 [Candidatus Bathyarchaeota archaeon]|nr:MAG: hypothetical protein IAX21_01920 [Candidatus Bathyarchaeota archaeon]